MASSRSSTTVSDSQMTTLMKESRMVQLLLYTGYSYNIIYIVLQTKVNLTGKLFNCLKCFRDMVSWLWISNDTKQLILHPKVNNDNGTNNECRICLVNSNEVVFFPCLHMVCCNSCTLQLKLCPICRKEIRYICKPIIC